MEMLFLDPMTAVKYGLPTPEDVAGRTGREILRAIIAGESPQSPIAETASLGIIVSAGAK